MAVPVASSTIAPPMSTFPANHQIVRTLDISGSTPVPVAQVLQTGIIGTAYSETISAQGGVSPYTFASIGALPTGLSLNNTTGVISGTPTTAASYGFTIKVTDTNGSTGTQAFIINVITAPSGGGNFGYAV